MARLRNGVRRLSTMDTVLAEPAPSGARRIAGHWRRLPGAAGRLLLAATGADRSATRPVGVDADIDQLVRDHGEAAYRVALSVTRDAALAEDVVQDAMIKAWQALPTFRGEAPLRNWVLRITHNTAISLLRKRRDVLTDPGELPDPLSGRSVDAQVGDRLAMEAFATALDDLDELSRSIVVLREVEQLSYDEICELLDVALPTVKTRLLRARRCLSDALDGFRP